MNFAELSAEDQQLVQTDLGDFDKLAAQQLAIADEMYTVGFEKLATETADYLDAMFAKVAEDEKDKEEEKMDEESEKKAAELGAFIERGYFDGLRKLGSERHGDELAYLMPFIEEKIAASGAKSALSRGWKAFKAYHKRGAGLTSTGAKRLTSGDKRISKMRGAKELGKGGAHFAPHAAAAGAAGAAAHHASKK